MGLDSTLRQAAGVVWRAIKVQAYAGFGRDRWQRPADVVDRLAIRPGVTIVDLGAGGGYFTFRLAAATGPAGRVYAVDSDPDMLAHLRARVAGERVSNVEVVEGSSTDAHLPAGGVDLVFTCDSYHHFSDRVAYFARLRPALRAGGRLAIIDYDGSSGIMARWLGHATGGHGRGAGGRGGTVSSTRGMAFRDRPSYSCPPPDLSALRRSACRSHSTGS